MCVFSLNKTVWEYFLDVSVALLLEGVKTMPSVAAAKLDKQSYTARYSYQRTIVNTFIPFKH